MRCQFVKLKATETGRRAYRCAQCGIVAVLSEKSIDEFASAIPDCEVISAHGKQRAMAMLGSRQQAGESGRQNNAMLDGTARYNLIHQMRDSIEAVSPPVTNEMDCRLLICEQCDKLQFDGCSVVCNCAERWIKWRNRVIAGACKELSKEERHGGL